MATHTVIHACGNDVSTDIIYPGRFMATVLPTETPQFAFADDAALNGKLKSGTVPKNSILVGGANFGCGSSREQACSTLKGWELTIIAKNFARIFLNNAVNLGLRTIICPDIQASEGDVLELHDDAVVNKTTGMKFPIIPLPKLRQDIINSGGLIPFTRKRVIERARA